jgi:hypothetical protein
MAPITYAKASADETGANNWVRTFRQVSKALKSSTIRQPSFTPLKAQFKPTDAVVNRSQNALAKVRRSRGSAEKISSVWTP